MKITIITIASTILALTSCKPGESDTKADTPQSSPADTANAIPYPLETCLVSGEKLGSMGKPAEIVHQGQQIKFCCRHCIPDFEKEPEKFMMKLKESQSSQLKKLP